MTTFADRLEPMRGELLRHCYRMTGSFTDAEDLVQDTMVRAWRAADSFDPGKASLRTWVFRIATNVCLTALTGHARRTLPSGLLGRPSTDPQAPLLPDTQTLWLQPLPTDPADIVAADEQIRLAFVTALQHLPPMQRAALLLRDVLGFSAAECAGMLEVSTASVTSALQRARRAMPAAPAAQPPDPEVVAAFVSAFQRADVAALVALLADDVELEMPPVPLWFRGREHYGEFMRRVFGMRGPDWRLVAASANGQPALAAYVAAGTGDYQLHSLQVLEVAGHRIRRNVVFVDRQVFQAFGLPAGLER